MGIPGGVISGPGGQRVHISCEAELDGRFKGSTGSNRRVPGKSFGQRNALDVCNVRLLKVQRYFCIGEGTGEGTPNVSTTTDCP